MRVNRGRGLSGSPHSLAPGRHQSRRLHHAGCEATACAGAVIRVHDPNRPNVTGSSHRKATMPIPSWNGIIEPGDARLDCDAGPAIESGSTLVASDMRGLVPSDPDCARAPEAVVASTAHAMRKARSEARRPADIGSSSGGDFDRIWRTRIR